MVTDVQTPFLASLMAPSNNTGCSFDLHLRIHLSSCACCLQIHPQSPLLLSPPWSYLCVYIYIHIYTYTYYIYIYIYICSQALRRAGAHRPDCLVSIMISISMIIMIIIVSISSIRVVTTSSLITSMTSSIRRNPQSASIITNSITITLTIITIVGITISTTSTGTLVRRSASTGPWTRCPGSRRRPDRSGVL